MSEGIKRTYLSWLNGEVKSEQKEYTQPTKLLADDGKLLAAGWARHNVFEYDRTKVRPSMRRKEWEYYLISNGKFSVLISFCNVSFGGYVNVAITDILHPDKSKTQLAGMIVGPATTYIGGRNKYVVPANGDMPNRTEFNVTGLGAPSHLIFDTSKNERKVKFETEFQGKRIVADFTMDIPDGHENLTTVIPFKDKPTHFFMTMKQNCLPCEGTFTYGDDVYKFVKDDSFCCVDWGRVCAPYRVNWYWGNGSTYLTDEEGNKHTFGFEITWGIGDESNATETCLFYDGKAHKIGAVDVEVFPKPDKYLKPWHLISDDGRFDFVMTPFYDNYSDLNIVNLVRVKCHQVYGKWNGKAILDDGTALEIKDMTAFCEYVENKW